MTGATMWQVRLNAHGRDLADGTAEHTAPAATIVHQEFHHSQIANAGVVHGNVTQNVTLNSDVADIVAALQVLQQAASDQPAGAAVAALAREAENELLDNGATAKAGIILGGLGQLVQSIAALKPAYHALQPIAAAHGLALPL